MTTDQRDRITALYHAALERAPAERPAFLDDVCAGDPVLRREVDSLLRVGSDAGSFLEAPAAVVAGPSAAGMVGRQLGPYRILGALGAGGMGEVYRARDSKLGRDVAIKLLPPHFTADPERRARFAREARLLATLNNPHIGAIYGLEDVAGESALVLELVEGPTLAARLARGPLPISDAVTVARQIAEALDAAHDKGIVHRDLKPANIVLQSASGASGVPSGDPRAKVLDFGLAKTMAVGLDADRAPDPSGSLSGTADGRILGTPAYMSPEQARGQAVDKRTDIWAFGCVLFEMLSGQRAFDGETGTDTLAAVLQREPDWRVLPRNTPTSIRTLLERCLQKDPRKRLHDIADARIELDDVDRLGGSVNLPAAAPRRRLVERLGWVVAVVLGVAVSTMAVLYLRGEKANADDPVEFSIAPVEHSHFTGTAPEFAISPDGRHLAFAATLQGVSTLWVRSLATLALHSIPGTEGAQNPFWSPDSGSLGFFASGQLKTVQVSGGSPIALCEALFVDAAAPSGTWNRSGVIVFSRARAPLQRVGQNGGTPTPVTTLAKNDTAHRWPAFLPDGQHFLYLAQDLTGGELRIGSLTSDDTVSLGPSDSHGVYAAGHLFFVRGESLVAQPFDADARRPNGAPLRLAAQTAVDRPFQRGMFSVSETGRLAYRQTARTPSVLTWLDRQEKPLGTAGDPGVFFNLDLSPDERWVAVSRLKDVGARTQVDIWLMDLARAGSGSRLTDDPAWDFDPAWSPDGKYVAYNSSSDLSNVHSLFVRPSDGSGSGICW